MIDKEGYRPNVGIILCNDTGQLFWGRRVGGRNAWQFPQGGIKKNETSEKAMYRELKEEIGLSPEDVQILACTDDWLRYTLPKQYIRSNSFPLCIGQKQIWYLLRLVSHDSKVRLNKSKKPEFDAWRWVDYWYPINNIVDFKRNVYTEALGQLEGIFNSFLRPRN
ncbi:MAG: RNA pyrophosphohydrolase [Thiotrichales bacterium]|nr:RNA pyrophosphohydrolase [Thiotrichales bacterium]